MRSLLSRSMTLVLVVALVPALAGSAWAAPAAPTTSPEGARPDRSRTRRLRDALPVQPRGGRRPDRLPRPGREVAPAHVLRQHDTSAASTYESLRPAPTTCRTEEDGSGYWVPALYRNGVEVKPQAMKVYYRTGRHEPESVKAFPAGFRVVAGDATATTAQGLPRRSGTVGACAARRRRRDSGRWRRPPPAPPRTR